MNNSDQDAHFSVYMNIISCILYQLTIIGMWIGSHKMVQMKLEDGDEMVGVKECNIEDNFGYAREWLMYEMLAYYIQISQLILFLVVS